MTGSKTICRLYYKSPPHSYDGSSHHSGEHTPERRSSLSGEHTPDWTHSAQDIDPLLAGVTKRLSWEQCEEKEDCGRFDDEGDSYPHERDELDKIREILRRKAKARYIASTSVPGRAPQPTAHAGQSANPYYSPQSATAPKYTTSPPAPGSSPSRPSHMTGGAVHRSTAATAKSSFTKPASTKPQEITRAIYTVANPPRISDSGFKCIAVMFVLSSVHWYFLRPSFGVCGVRSLLPVFLGNSAISLLIPKGKDEEILHWVVSVHFSLSIWSLFPLWWLCALYLLSYCMVKIYDPVTPKGEERPSKTNVGMVASMRVFSWVVLWCLLGVWTLILS